MIWVSALLLDIDSWAALLRTQMMDRILYYRKFVSGMVMLDRTLAAVASSQSQAAFAALTKSLQSEWLFSLQVIPHCGLLFADLESSLSSCFLPALFGVEVSAIER